MSVTIQDLEQYVRTNTEGVWTPLHYGRPILGRFFRYEWALPGSTYFQVYGTYGVDDLVAEVLLDEYTLASAHLRDAASPEEFVTILLSGARDELQAMAKSLDKALEMLCE